MITIVDYGMGNIGSVANMLKKIGSDVKIADQPVDLLTAKKIILPGVGSFDIAMTRIYGSGLFNTLNKLVIEEKIPVLGICLGMQILLEGSEEGKLPGFGWIKGKAYNFKGEIPGNLKIPHMGWRTISEYRENLLNKNLDGETRFYFVHSFYVKVENETDSIMKCNYGIDFDAAVSHENIYGCQFHPEKSHKFGMQFLRNFITA